MKITIEGTSDEPVYLTAALLQEILCRDFASSFNFDGDTNTATIEATSE